MKYSFLTFCGPVMKSGPVLVRTPGLGTPQLKDQPKNSMCTFTLLANFKKKKRFLIIYIYEAQGNDTQPI